MKKKSALIFCLMLLPLILISGMATLMLSAEGIEGEAVGTSNSSPDQWRTGNEPNIVLTETQPVAYLPVIFNNYCPDYSDDFSNPLSGWPVGEDSFVKYEYLNDEYRVLNKKPGFFFFFAAPAYARENYEVEVDARWVGEPGQSYGIIFGISGDFEKYYLFDINTDFKLFRLNRYDSNVRTEIVKETAAPSMNGGTGTNRLGVIRNGSDITLSINSVVLGSWTDNGISGMTRAGVLTNPYPNKGPYGDARFDDFRMACYYGSNNGVVSTPSGLENPSVFRAMSGEVLEAANYQAQKNR